ncbi:unnamed protein product, partial [marine sediment metagenome]
MSPPPGTLIDNDNHCTDEFSEGAAEPAADAYPSRYCTSSDPVPAPNLALCRVYEDSD